VQGVELVNGDTFYPEAFPWVEEKGLTIFADSDVHSPIADDYQPRLRPVTLVFARSASETDIRDALVAGRTTAWQADRLWGKEEHLRGLWSGAVRLENAELTYTPETRIAALQLRNFSAIPFRGRIMSAPDWLRVSDFEVKPEATAGVRASITKQAPTGRHKVELELEITNLHIEPGRNLVVRLPFEVDVRP
jgi:hypothetical protein